MADPNDQPGRGLPSSPGQTSSSLLEQLRAGDPEAWDRMARLYYPWVYARVHGQFRRAGWNLDEVRDVVQEVFLAIKKSLPGFRRERKEDTFRGWIWGIAKHKIQDYARRRVALQQLSTDVVAPPEGQEEEIDDTLSPGATARLVRRALQGIRAEFRADLWEAFWRVTVGEEVPAEVAVDLGVSRNVVYKARSAILRRLREEMGDLQE